jgi:hypothetical protein
MAAGVLVNNIVYFDGVEPPYLTHLLVMTNLAGYISWGGHSSLGNGYAENNLHWQGNSGWWIIRTEESFNGQRYVNTQSSFVRWFASGAFGGVNYSNTPIGAVSYPDEPHADATDNSKYFRFWAAGKNFGVCAWESKVTIHLQPVGDPLLTR